MNPAARNPFPDDPDRCEIWDVLMRRDFESFLAADWSMTGPDFLETEFAALSGRLLPDPGEWRLRFPSLASYRDEWLGQAAEFQKIELKDISKLDFLYQSATLREIEITGTRAVARKKFDGTATTTAGAPITLRWQTLYFLRKAEAHWKITGFLGYLPNPPQSQLRTVRTFSEIEGLPAPRGPFAQGVTASGEFLFVSGQGPYDPNLGRFVREDVAEQTRLTLACLDRVLRQAGSARDQVVSCRVYLQPLNSETFAAMNAGYREFFGSHRPARTTIGAQLLDFDVEIDCVAVLK
jgi:enamine deaminase RidA (YjgF/YER057c/UK114 family)